MGGKKGKMTDYGSSHEKWAATQYLRDLPTNVTLARKKSYDESAILAKKLGDDLLLRRRRNYFHLRTLIDGRIYDDVREDQGDRRWIQGLTSGNAKALKTTQDKAYNSGRFRAASFIISNSQRSSVNKIPSLSEMSLDSIARNLSGYETETLKQCLRALPPDMTEMLSLFCTQYQTINDDTLDCLANPLVQSLILGDAISDIGLSKILFSWNHLSSQQLEEPDNWWETSLCSYDIPFGRSVLKRLTLLGCPISFKGLSLVRQQFSNIEFLIIHGIDFRHDFDLPDDVFRSIFTLISTGFPFLKELHLSYCPWVSLNSLNTLVGSIRNVHENITVDQIPSVQKSSDNKDFEHSVKLSKITVQGIYDKDNLSLNDIENLVSKFQKFCNITLVLTL
mmetsp:Transcript_32248/g.30737  ORF Transcript_32248/g.30737 Transcript_32248/m.30737 type:complete len:393 (-) Transcript_32248:177-1355(-)